MERCTLNDAKVELSENCYIIPSARHTTKEADVVLREKEKGEYTLREILYGFEKKAGKRTTQVPSQLEATEPSPDIILIDTPPDESMMVHNAVIASDYVLIPCVPSQLDLEGVNETIDFLRECIVEYDLDLEYAFVQTRVLPEREHYSRFIRRTLKNSGDLFGPIHENFVLRDFVPSSGLTVNYFLQDRVEKLKELEETKAGIERDIETIEKAMSEEAGIGLDEDYEEFETYLKNAESSLKLHLDRIAKLEGAIQDAKDAERDFKGLTESVIKWWAELRGDSDTEV